MDWGAVLLQGSGDHQPAAEERPQTTQASFGGHPKEPARNNGGSSHRSVEPLRSPLEPGMHRAAGKTTAKMDDFHNSLSNVSLDQSSEQSSPMLPSIDSQEDLLGSCSLSSMPETASLGFEHAVLFSADAYQQEEVPKVPQFALLGSHVAGTSDSNQPIDKRIFLNTNVPFSAFICGLQGSGKSHTTSCIIENSMVSSSKLGVLQAPSSALVLHYGEHSTSTSFRPCEFAFLSSLNKEVCGNANRLPVTVLVSPSNYPTLKTRYEEIPGVVVRPFLIQTVELTTETMLALMAVSKTKTPPLYISQVTNILRQMNSETSEGFCYQSFQKRLDETELDPSQRQYLDQRLDLLESFIDLSGKAPETRFAQGEIKILDLSCPFVDESTACTLFNIGLSKFVESPGSRGKLVVLDEAHKFMRNTPGAKELTAQLLSMIRQQRHYGLRVVVSTQEPYLAPSLIDLCSMIVIHRFNSPAWLAFLKKHVSTEAEDAEALFREISELQTGEAIVFAPSAVLSFGDSPAQKAGGRKFKMAMRKRITWDSGKSVLSV